MLEYDISSGTGRNLVFLHAGICDRRMWNPQWATLGERYRSVRTDIAGFGDSELPEESFSNTIDVVEVMEDAGVSPAVLVGASMGGAIALDTALSFPDRVDGLVLVCSAIAGHDWSPEVAAYNDLEEAALDEGDREAAAAINVRFWVDGPQRTPGEVDPDVRRDVHEMQLRIYELQEPAPPELEQHPIVPDLRSRLGEIRCPALVITGSLDRADIQVIADGLLEGLPNARSATIEGTAHLPSMERPAEFDRLVTDFVDSLPR